MKVPYLCSLLILKFSTQKWQQMNENLKIVDLVQNSKEYRNIEKEFLTNNEDFEVIQILKIQNKRLYNAHKFFGENFMEMAKHRHPNSYTKCLWHGTTDEAARNINQYGFNRSYRGKNACAYGDGVYFATEPSYSSNDTYAVPDSAGRKRVYKCSVYVGRYTRGEHAMKDPPIDRDGVRFDSTVNDPEDPTIHVIFFDNQAYMENLIIFKRNMYRRY